MSEKATVMVPLVSSRQSIFVQSRICWLDRDTAGCPDARLTAPSIAPAAEKDQQVDLRGATGGPEGCSDLREA